jgi:DnaJ-domain-containing protein 1
LQGVLESMIETDLIGACFLSVAVPLFYFYRRLQLRMEHARQFCTLKSFALTDPDRLIHREATGPTASDATAPEAVASEQPVESPPTAPSALPEESPCFSVLGVSSSATVEEIKQAYKTQVWQNHPDRVHDMSQAFRELAEAQTKKLNAAYQQALMSLQHV